MFDGELKRKLRNKAEECTSLQTKVQTLEADIIHLQNPSPESPIQKMLTFNLKAEGKTVGLLVTDRKHMIIMPSGAKGMRLDQSITHELLVASTSSISGMRLGGRYWKVGRTTDETEWAYIQVKRYLTTEGFLAYLHGKSKELLFEANEETGEFRLYGAMQKLLRKNGKALVKVAIPTTDQTVTEYLYGKYVDPDVEIIFE